MIILNVKEEQLEVISKDLSLPSSPDIKKLEEIISFLYGIEEIETNKFLKMQEWLFSIITNLKELNTAIVYGMAHKVEESNIDSFISVSDQPFYHPPLSYFANHSVALAFSLGDKLAQFINVVEDINKDIDKVTLYNLTEVSKTPQMQDSKFLKPLKAIAEKRTTIKDIRNNKIHKAESELIRNNVQFSEGFINNKPTTFIMQGIDNLPVVPYQTLLKSKEFYALCTDEIKVIIKLTEDYLLDKYEEYLEDFNEMGVYKIGMGLNTSFTNLDLE